MPQQPDFYWLFLRPNGRISRAVYALASLLLIVIPAIPLYKALMALETGTDPQGWSALFTVVFLATLWPNLALCAKRLHDMGRPALWSVLFFVPFLNTIAFVLLCVLPGNPGPNAYGERSDAAG